MNAYGLDVEYFKKELASLSRTLNKRTPDELERYLIRLADVASSQASSCPGCKGYGIVNHGISGLSWCGCPAGDKAKQLGHPVEPQKSKVS